MALILLVRGILYSVMQTPLFTKRVIILGTGKLARSIAQEIEAAPHCGYTVIGFVSDSADSPPEPFFSSPYPILGPLGQLEKINETCRPDAIIVALTERRQRLPVQELLYSCAQGIEVEDGIDICIGVTAFRENGVQLL